jgi:hypothetical protein
LVDLFFPGTVSNTGKISGISTDNDHLNAYNALEKRMNEDAPNFVDDIFNGQHIAEEMNFDQEQNTIRIKAKPRDYPDAWQMRNGLQVDKASSYIFLAFSIVASLSKRLLLRETSAELPEFT